VYKGKLKLNGANVDVAVKEMQKNNKVAIYDFQHESVIMRYVPVFLYHILPSVVIFVFILFLISKLRHINLVRLYGITKSPLRMVLEFVPNSDLHELLMQKHILPIKWKLKMAIDTACGMRYF